MRIKHIHRIAASVIAVAVLLVVFLPFAGHAAADYECGYDFNSVSDLTWDLAGKYSLVEQSYDPMNPVRGYTGTAVSSSIGLFSRMFRSNIEMTFSARFLISEDVDGKLFNAGSGTVSSPYLTLEYLSAKKKVCLTFFDGSVTEVLYADMADAVGKNARWVMISFVFRYATPMSRLSLYKDGKVTDAVNTSAALDNLSPLFAHMPNFSVDDLYISNSARSDTDISKLYSMSIKDFLVYRGVPVTEHSGTADPTQPTNPYDPSDPTRPTEPYIPTPGDDGLKFNWVAYCFDKSIDITRDSNRLAPATVNVYAVNRIDTSKFGGSTGYGLTRRVDVVPSEYMKLNRDMLHSASEFTIGMWVYRDVDKESEYYNDTEIKVLDFSGAGYLVFAPFSSEAYIAVGTSYKYVDAYTGEETYEYDPFARPVPQEVSKISSSLSRVNNRWCYVALTYDKTGKVTVYIDGKVSTTVETGYPLSVLALTDLKILTGVSTYDGSRFIIDEIYIDSTALADTEIPKLRSYGIDTYVSEVIPDHGKVDPGDHDVVPDESDLLEDKFASSAIINGFVGTTFDVSSFIGKDVNNAVSATVRNPSLSQGIINYGLTLDGISSYIRYPKGILDNASEMSISVAYKWNGPANGTTQKLFDFSAKASSIAAPTAYVRLEMGDGLSGLCLRIYDGVTENTITTGVNAVGSWVRATVVFSNGIVRLYVNGAEVGKTYVFSSISDIKPNFCYVGRSGVKGEALFKGVIDEIYISDSALTSEQIQQIQEKGIDPTAATEPATDPGNTSSDIWDGLIRGVIIITVILVLIIIGVIVATILKK